MKGPGSLAVTVVALLALSGCNCSGLGERTDCGEFAGVLDAYCGAIERCPDLYPLAIRNRQECIDTLCFVLTCRLESDEVNNVRTFKVEQQKPIVDSTRVQGCVGYLNQSTCAALAADMHSGSTGSSSGTTEPKNACDGLLRFDDTGSSGVGPGMSCENDSCQQGLYCTQTQLDADAGAMTCRTCKVLPGIGEKCTPSYSACAAGLVCDRGAGAYTCIVPLANGASCQDSEACASKFCNSGTRQCDPGGKPGEACAAKTDCRQGFCNAQGACEDLHKGGQACSANEQCANNRCDPGTGVCGLPDGSTCQTYNDAMCASGNCDDPTQKCAPRKADGAQCQSAVECVSNYCNSSTRTCTPHCYTDRDCAAGEWCNNNSGSNSYCLPLKADGESCQGDEECVAQNCRSNDKCGPPPGLGDACVVGECYPAGHCSGGVCVKGKAPGEACAALDECQAPYICREKTCQAMNLACRPGKLDEGCAFLRVCDEATWCDMSTGFVCKAKKAQGSSCSQGSECAAGLTCVYGNSGGTCSPQLALGEACVQATDCLAGLNCVRVAGGTSSTCQAPPAGNPCGYNEPCPSGFFCTSRDFCEPQKPQGASCSGGSSSEECADGLYCESTCKPKGSVGDACASYRPCKSELHCDSSTSKCVADAALGQPCSTSSNECEPTLFCDTSASPAVCAAKRGTGGACSGDEQCQSGACYGSFGCLVGDACVMP